MAGKKGQATMFETEKRVKIIADEVLNGMSRGRIMTKYAEAWDLSEASIDNYIAKAYAYIKENVKQDIENIREANTNRLIEIYRESQAQGDKTSMFRALDMINRIFGLYTDRKELAVAINEFNFKFAE